MKVNGKSFGEELRMVASYTFYRMIIHETSWKIRFCDVVENLKINLGALEFPPSEPVR